MHSAGLLVLETICYFTAVVLICLERGTLNVKQNCLLVTPYDKSGGRASQRAFRWKKKQQFVFQSVPLFRFFVGAPQEVPSHWFAASPRLNVGFTSMKYSFLDFHTANFSIHGQKWQYKCIKRQHCESCLLWHSDLDQTNTSACNKATELYAFMRHNESATTNYFNYWLICEYSLNNW